MARTDLDYLPLGKLFYAGPQAAGPLGSKPALAEVDGTHARVAVVDTAAATSTVTGVTVATKAREVNLVRAGGRVWMTRRADAAVGDANGEEVWLKELTLGSSGVDLSKAAVALPRSGEHRVGNRRQARGVGRGVRVGLGRPWFGARRHGDAPGRGGAVRGCAARAARRR